jgi:hypothetical protein
MSSKPKQWATLPPNFSSLTDCLIDEAASFRRCSRWEIFRKIREGELTSYKDGRVRKVVVASLIADRERALAATLRKSSSPHLDAAPTGKRPIGRPRKARAEQPQPASGRRVLEATS